MVQCTTAVHEEILILFPLDAAKHLAREQPAGPSLRVCAPWLPLAPPALGSIFVPLPPLTWPLKREGWHTS